VTASNRALSEPDLNWLPVRRDLDQFAGLQMPLLLPGMQR